MTTKEEWLEHGIARLICDDINGDDDQPFMNLVAQIQDDALRHAAGLALGQNSLGHDKDCLCIICQYRKAILACLNRK